MPPGGPIATQLARLFGSDPGLMIERELRAFKQLLEVGEIVHSDASIHPGMHPAQPVDSGEVSRLLSQSPGQA
jgi:hypothetical protein